MPNLPEEYVAANPPCDTDPLLEDVSSLGHSFSLLLNDPRNKVPCLVRDEVMAIYFKLQHLNHSLSKGKAWARCLSYTGSLTTCRRILPGWWLEGSGVPLCRPRSWRGVLRWGRLLRPFHLLLRGGIFGGRCSAGARHSYAASGPLGLPGQRHCHLA